MSDPAAPETYFESLYRDAPFGYLVTDESDIVVRVNTTLLALGGFDESSVVGSPLRDLLAPGSQLLYETRHLPVLRLQGHSTEVFLQLSTASGPTLPVLLNAAVVAGGTEVLVGILDASNRVSYERQLLTTQRTAEDLAARVTVLQNASAAFAASNTETQIADSLAAILEDALVARAACVALLNDRDELDVVAGTDLLDGLVLGDVHLLGSTVLASELPVIVGTGANDEAIYPWVVAALRQARLRTVAVFPIMSDSTPIGVTAAFFGRERVLSESERDMVLSVARQASQGLTRLRAQTQLAFAARHDQLTGLANRASLRASIADGLATTAYAARPLSVMFLDLDGFKTVNDRLGHTVGDAVLREVASRLRASVRGSDIVGRYGGDEYVVVSTDTAGDAAALIAERIHAAIRAPFDEAPGFEITASIGLAVHGSSAPTTTVDTLIATADTAMYESKRHGRDRTTRVQA